MTNIIPIPQKYDFTVLQARKSKERFRMNAQHAARFGIYLVGMVLLALGITLNTKAGLGASALARCFPCWGSGA